MALKLSKFLSLLMLLLVAGIAPETAEFHRTYLPVVTTLPPLPASKSGIAWNKAGYNDVKPFGFSQFHTWTIFEYTAENLPPARWENVKYLRHNPYFSCPVRPYEALRDPSVPVQEDLMDALQELAGDGYEGVVYFLNEPNHPGQCTLSPAEAVQIYMEVTAVCPACRFTMPNVSDWDYLAGWTWTKEYLSILQALHAPQPAYGAFHVYRYPVQPVIDSYESLLYEFGVDVPLMITEYGNCDPQTAVAMHNELLADGRVEEMYWFTAVGYGCTDLFVSTSDNVLTLLGENLLGAIRP